MLPLLPLLPFDFDAARRTFCGREAEPPPDVVILLLLLLVNRPLLSMSAILTTARDAREVVRGATKAPAAPADRATDAVAAAAASRSAGASLRRR